MFTLPTDIILHIFSFFPLSDICQLLKNDQQQSLNFYVKQILLTRVKNERWEITLCTPSTYFAILCNRDMMMTFSEPIAKLTCVGYNSQSEYLRFETSKPTYFEMSDEDEEGEVEFQSMRIYCSQWIKLFKEDDRSGQIKLVWREGDQTKQFNDDLWIGYKCTKSAVLSADTGCTFCKANNRCNKHAFISSPSTNIKKRLLQIHSIRVSLNWLKQGLIM